MVTIVDLGSNYKSSCGAPFRATVDSGYSSQLGNSDFGYYIERTTITRDYYIERRESTTDFGYYIERFDF